MAGDPGGWPYEHHQISVGARLQPTLSLALAADPIGWPNEYSQLQARARLHSSLGLALAAEWNANGWPYERHEG